MELKALKAEVEELRKEPAKLRADLEKLQRAKDHERRGSRSLRKVVWRFSSSALSCPCEVCMQAIESICALGPTMSTQEWPA